MSFTSPGVPPWWLAASCLLGLSIAACAGNAEISRALPAGAEAAPSGPLNAQHWWIPVPDQPGNGKTLMLEAMVYRPPGSGPFPLVEINHGVPGNARTSDLGRERPGFLRASAWFVEHGFAVVVPLRRGFGKSQGDYGNDTPRGCAPRRYYDRAIAASRDEAAVLDYLRQQDFVDPRRLIVVGQSAGGLAAMALAIAPPEGVRAFINFAGGSGSDGNGVICGGEDALLSAVRGFGVGNKLPQLWLYAENDAYFLPDLVQRMLQVYTNGSRPPVTFVALPAYGNDGHQTLARADTGVWSAAVDDFLRQWAQ